MRQLRKGWTVAAGLALACAVTACSAPSATLRQEPAPVVSLGTALPVPTHVPNVKHARPSPHPLVRVLVSPRPSIAPQLPVPPRVDGDVFYTQTYGAQRVLHEFDWSGHQVRTITLSFDVQSRGLVQQSPDGSFLLAGDRLVAADGHVVPHRALAYTWADDNRHRCNLETYDSQAAHYEVDITGPDEVMHKITALPDSPPRTAPTLLLCSLQLNRVVVSEASASGNGRALFAYRLSDGRKEPIRAGTASAGPTDCPDPNTMSGNGRYVADGGSHGGPVCDLRTGRAVGHVTGIGWLDWAGHRMVQEVAQSGRADYCDVYDWRTRTEVWSGGRASDHGCYPSQVTHPGTDDVILALNTTGPWAAADLWLVPSLGRPRIVARGIDPRVL